MALKEALLNILNNNEEPLQKRLKIADNAFKSTEVNLQHRELFLLKWLVQTKSSTNSLTIWDQCHTWLKTDSFQELRSSDIAPDDIEVILQRIQGEFKCEKENVFNTLILVISAMVDSPVFQHYFKENIKEYVLFLKNVFINCVQMKFLCRLLIRHEKFFGKKIVSVENFDTLVYDELFLCFVNLLVKCDTQEHEKIFECMSSIIEKHAFQRNSDVFSESLTKIFTSKKTEKHMKVLSFFVDKIQEAQKENEHFSFHSHRLLYSAFCRRYKQQPSLLFHFFVYLVENLGFHCTRFKTPKNTYVQLHYALSGLKGLLEIISVNNLKFIDKINEFSFDDALQNLLLCIISTTKAPMHESCFQIIDLIIKISPLTVEANVSLLLVYLMTTSSDKLSKNYSVTMCNIFGVFIKLHRIQNLISKIIRTLQPIYVENKFDDYFEKLKVAEISFVGIVSMSNGNQNGLGKCVELNVEEILPEDVLRQFTDGTTGMATKQVSNLFKTFTFHLDELIGHDLAEKSKNASYVTFIEILCRLLCNFLEKMNIASANFRATNVIEKITKHIDETQGVLDKFGNALVNIEHNQNLMLVFLQLSYIWGELNLLIQSALMNDNNELGDMKNEAMDTEITSCDVSCLHSYLSPQTWCLIAERISNFGELPCKKIMEKLWIQKVRFLILSGLDTPTILEHISTLIKTLTPLNDYYEYLVTNEFASTMIMHRMDPPALKLIADCILDDVLKNTADDDIPHIPLDILKRVIESRKLVIVLITSIFRRMNKLHKGKHKGLSSTTLISPLVFERIEDNLLSEDIDSVNLGMSDIFVNCLEAGELLLKSNKSSNQVNRYLLLLKQLPLVFLERSVQISLFYYLFAVFCDMKSSGNCGDVGSELEMLLIGIGQTKILTLNSILPTQMMVKTVISYFDNFQDMFFLLMQTQSVDAASYKDLLDCLRKNLDDAKYLKCLSIYMKHLHKHKKSTELMKILEKSMLKLCESLLSLISSSKTGNSSIYLEILIECLQNGKVPITESFVLRLEEHLEKICTVKMEVNEGELAFFQFAFNNNKFQTNKSELVSNIAKVLNNVQLRYDLVYNYSQNVLIVLQCIESIDEFQGFLHGILERSIKSIDNVDALQIEMKVWRHILNSSIKTEKAEVLQKAIEKLLSALFEKLIVEKKNGNDPEQIFNVLMDVELNLLENTQHLLTYTSLDLCFGTLTLRMQSSALELSYKRTIDMLEALLKHRQALVCDRLPIFLQEYRLLLRALCANSDTNNKLHTDKHLDTMAELAHLLEKLTINLCKLKAHVASVAIYLIADILNEYEAVTIYPAVKLALNNCIYNLIVLCNQHSIASLMRALSPGSTAIFKMAYENYKKYHRFTGKV